MKTYEELAKLRDNNITTLEQLDQLAFRNAITSCPSEVTSTVSPCFQAADEIIKSQKRKPGRPKLNKVKPTFEDVILKEYKSLESEYKKLELDLKIAQKENEILRCQLELKELQSIKSSYVNP